MPGLEKYSISEIQFTPAVVGFLIKDSKVLLGLRKKVSVDLGLNLVAGIGGKRGDIEGLEEETDEEALVREFEEEIKVTPLAYERVGRVKFLWTGHPERKMDVVIYIIKDWAGDPEETEFIKPSWYKINSLPFEQMWEDYSEWVPLVLNGSIIDAVFIYGEEEIIIERYIEVLERPIN